MKKHKKQITIQPKLNGKKELERQTRITAAQQNMRLYSFTSILLMLFSAWRESPTLNQDMKTLPANEQRYINMQTGKCKKCLEKMVVKLHKKKKWPGEDSPFFKDTSDKMALVLTRIKEVLPKGYLFLHVHIIATYIFFVALADWWDMSDKQDDDCWNMLREIMTFSNHIIQNDSPLLEPMNKVFWETRNYLHNNAMLPVYDFDSFPKGTAEYERRHKETVKEGCAVA